MSSFRRRLPQKLNVSKWPRGRSLYWVFSENARYLSLNSMGKINVLIFLLMKIEPVDLQSSINTSFYCQQNQSLDPGSANFNLVITLSFSIRASKMKSL